MNQIKKLISSIVITVLLLYILFTTDDKLTRIVVIPFLTFSLVYFLKCIFLLLQKKKLAAIMGKVYVIDFAVYWFGFLIIWDFISILRKEYLSVLLSLILWVGGGWILCRRLKRK